MPSCCTMKTHSSRSPAAGSSSFCQTATHPPRTSKPAKASTPTASPRPPFSGGQTTPPILSPSRPPDGRAASPNYFGLVVDSASDARQLSGLGRDAWGPAASSVKSFAAALPKQMLLEPTADVEAFRRQADLNRAQAFLLPASQLTLAQPAPRPASGRPHPSRWHTRTSDAGSDASSVAPSAGSGREPASSNTDTAGRESQHDSAYVSSESKRSSMSSLPPAHITSLPVFESPRSLQVTRRPSTLASTDGELTARLSLPDISAEASSPPATADPVGRAATLPSKPDAGPLAMISAARLKELIETVDDSRLLVLDIRSSQNYAQSRIEGALNLCIPTTLLKRPNFNIQKLQQTFQGGRGSAKFAAWRSMQWIVVYDAHASDKRDAVAVQNMVKKFINEGFTGHTAILRGGFSLFHKSYPKLVDGALAPPAASPSGCAVRGNGGLAPVIGGVHLPRSTGEVDPFFSNIRQNLDLADGVGQLDIARPADLESPLLPQWLREAASISDHGKAVSNKFLHIELEEQARMRTAYAAFQPGLEQQGNLRLCGVEKGGKNRYKDILPFEHARVRLQTRPAGSCDYINASHLTASMSNKRYIASQGPLPATFEDFWSVVWDQDVRVIVMLTAETEGGQLKCHSYWKGRDFGTLRMRQLSEQKASLDVDKHRTEKCPTCSANPASDLGRKRANTTTTLESSTAKPNCAGCQGQTEAAYVMIRKFALSHSAEPFAPAREITHLCFPSWPDFGAPAQPSHLLALVELANLMQRAAPPVEEAASAAGGRAKAVDCMPLAWYDEPEVDIQARPMLVHCSAGCGRTGTFCTVDSVIDMLKRQRRAKMAAMCAGGPRGDSPMTAPDEAVSPRSRQAAGGPDPGFLDTAAGRSAAYAEAAGPGGCDMSWVGDEAVDLIQKTVRDFREQRLSMVQSLRQYVLCYETILEWLNRIRDRTASSLGGRMRSGSLQQLLSAR